MKRTNASNNNSTHNQRVYLPPRNVNATRPVISRYSGEPLVVYSVPAETLTDTQHAERAMLHRNGIEVTNLVHTQAIRTAHIGNAQPDEEKNALVEAVPEAKRMLQNFKDRMNNASR